MVIRVKDGEEKGRLYCYSLSQKISSRDDVEAEEVLYNPGGAANDPGETFDLIRHYFDRKFDSLKTEIIAETHLVEESSRIELEC